MPIADIRIPLAVGGFAAVALFVTNFAQSATGTVAVGQAVTLSVIVDGTPPFSYQWYKDGVVIAGATNAAFSISSVQTTDVGSYDVIVSNSAGFTTSDNATLSVVAASAPVFTTQPASQTFTAGASVTFSAAASGSPAPTYQWQKNGTNISGGTSASYTITRVATGDAGTYTVVATNSAGSATSNGAVLTVNPAASTAAVPTIMTQPCSQTATAGASVTFSVAAGGSPAPIYQWQRLPAGSASWENLNDGGSYHGVTSTSLTVSATTSAMSGDQFRCVITNSAGSSISDAVALTVPGAATALLQYPASIAEDGSGNFYVADASNNTILKISPAGAVSTLAGTAGVAGSQDGTGNSALFNQPSGVAVDGTGNVFVADTGNATLRKITASGTVSTLAGSPAGRGGQDGTGSAASFSAPVGLAVDGAGNLYVADAFNATIRKVTPTGAVSTLAGAAASRGEADGMGSAARFNYPNGVAVDGTGNVYVADTYNDTIRKITPAGVVTTLAGSAGISGATDLTGINALFNQPYGVAVDAAGDVCVADTGNGEIRRITPAGAVGTVAGVAGIAGLGDGTGSRALFNQPRGVVVDGSGIIYVADTGNGALRRITADGSVTTVALSAASAANPTPPSSGTPTGTSPSGTGTGTATASGGGGGAVEPWFVLMLILLTAASWAGRRLPGLPVRHS